MSIFRGPIYRTHHKTPGHDCIYAPCAFEKKCTQPDPPTLSVWSPKFPGNNHGISGGADYLVVISVLPDDRKIALSLALGMNRYPETIPLSHFCETDRAVTKLIASELAFPYESTRSWPGGWGAWVTPRAMDLSLHVQTANKPGARSCDWFGEHGCCEIAETTALGAIELFAGFSSPDGDGFAHARKTVEPAREWHRHQGPSEALWKRLEDRLEHLADRYLAGDIR